MFKYFTSVRIFCKTPWHSAKRQFFWYQEGSLCEFCDCVIRTLQVRTCLYLVRSHSLGLDNISLFFTLVTDQETYNNYSNIFYRKVILKICASDLYLFFLRPFSVWRIRKNIPYLFTYSLKF